MRENASLQRTLQNERGDYIATTKALYDNRYLTTPAECIEMILHRYNNADDSAIFDALRSQNYFDLEGLNLVEQADQGLDLFGQLRKAGCMNLEGLQALVDTSDYDTVSFALQLPMTFGLHGLGRDAIDEIVGIFQHIHLFGEQVPLRHPQLINARTTDVVDWIKIVCGAELFYENTPEVTLRWNKEVFAKVLEVFRNHPNTTPEDRQNAVCDAILAITSLRLRSLQ